MRFAKLFERGKKQVLIRIDSGEKMNPEVRFYFQPQNLGICSVAIEYKDDSDKSWKNADKFFNGIDEEKAFAFAEKCMERYELELEG